MSRDHNEWLKLEFQNKYLKPSYRNAIIHASFIEGLVKRESGKKYFSVANSRLLKSNKITKPEFEIFEDIRKLRNSLLHDIFIQSLDETPINNMIENLMKDIMLAYCISQFLKEKIIKPYKIKLPE